ncbi:gliding motility-associated C-terminal domain-containing protein [Parabacteroides bouchesdurhonensis]|uniref:T9SS type B sorting domain-containing protein n=1 Tax=Parabacteroides bouchesdurhonensis TaxID=1936995 RepID=UPI000C84A696|nr:gliding motility-associated C-terminal domain-containing protein [Parabacteroides bouchesdurhonensis]
MLRKDFRKSGIIICLLLLAVAAIHAQYRVTGGAETPLLAEDDTPNRLQVYMVYGANDVEISYTSSSTSHQWYRYKTRMQDAERIPCVQNGTTSTIRNVEDGYGYYVGESSIIAQRYVWIIDYSKHAFEISGLYVSDKGDPCSSVHLTGTAEMDKLSYRTPSGTAGEVKREFEVTYNTMAYSSDTKMFSQVEKKETVSDPFSVSLPAPLCDTDFLLKGDQFACHFNREKSISTGEYQAVAIEVHADSSYVADEPLNMSTAQEGLCAPVTVRFTAHANEPVAALYIWTIYENKEGSENPEEEDIDPIIRYTGDEVEYTFQQAGNFTARLEVSDRTGTCSETEEITLSVSDSFLDIPNAFSPGTTPGINDEFRVVYKSLVRFSGTIFNRWGTQMFHWTDPAKGWDGKKGGKYVPPGVYFYVIEATGSDGKKYKKSGDINILRPKTIDDQIHD